MNRRTRSLLPVALGAVVCAAILGACSAEEPPQEEAPSAESEVAGAWAPNDPAAENARRLYLEGRDTFRNDTFGDEEFWGGTLRLHEALRGVSPRAALALGLKVDADRLPASLVRALQRGQVDLDSSETTATLLRLNAVVGVKGFFEPKSKELASVGIQCAFCHSTVDDRVAPGVGRRRDGWPNRDLDVGKIVDLSPNLGPVAALLGAPESTVRTVLRSWGPGKYDAALFLDGKALRPDGTPAATLIPPAFGMAGVSLHTFTGWGSVTHWNALVATVQMHGKGTFFDPRLDDASRFPVAARAGFGHLTTDDDRVSPKLAGLQFYQLALAAPTPPHGSFDPAAAKRGGALFGGKAKCASCHVPPLFTEPGWNAHSAEEIGIDEFQASRSPEGRYRTTPLRGSWAHAKGGYYHDGRFPTLGAVVEHYDRVKSLGLSDREKNDLVEYLRSL